MKELANILAAILYQEVGRYELKQESINAVGDEPEVSFTDPIAFTSSYGTQHITVVTLEEEA